MLRNTSFYNSFHNFSVAQNKLISDDNFTYSPILKIFNRYLKPKDTVLDIGCGVGVLSLYFGKKCRLVYGIDVSDKVIRLAKESVKKIKLIGKVKFYVINFPTDYFLKKFDKIIFSETLEHISEEELAIKSVHKMLRKAGKLIITVPSENSLLYKIGLSNKFDAMVGHLRRYSISGLNSLLTKNGFRVLKVYKREGIIRNIMFTISPFNFFIKFMRGYIGRFVNWLDNRTIKLIGESQIIVVAVKK